MIRALGLELPDKQVQHTTHPQSASQLPIYVLLFCTTGHRIPLSATNQGPKKSNLIRLGWQSWSSYSTTATATLSHRVYWSIDYRTSTPPPNCDLNILIGHSKQ